MSVNLRELAERWEELARFYDFMDDDDGVELNSRRSGRVEIWRVCAAQLRAALPDMERLVEALRHLRNECSGALGIAMPELHAALGNTNVNCLKRRIEEADAALAPFDQPGGAAPETPSP